MLEEEIKKVRVREKGIERKRVMDRRRGQFSHLTHAWNATLEGFNINKTENIHRERDDAYEAELREVEKKLETESKREELAVRKRCEWKAKDL